MQCGAGGSACLFETYQAPRPSNTADSVRSSIDTGSIN